MKLERLIRRDRLFFLITGLVEGILTALTLSGGKMLRPHETITAGLAIRIGLAAGFPTAVVFFAAEYARQRQELRRMAHQLNITRHQRLVDGNLGQQAWREAFGSALVSGLCSLIGAAAPLLAASQISGSGWPAVAVAVGCLAALGSGIGYATLSCKVCWAFTLMIAGCLLAGLGYMLQVV